MINPYMLYFNDIILLRYNIDVKQYLTNTRACKIAQRALYVSMHVSNIVIYFCTQSNPL